MAPIDFKDKELAILQEISSAIAQSDNINAISNILLDLAMSHTGASKGSLMLVDSKDRLYIFTSRGFEEKLTRTYRIPIGEGIAGTVAASRQAVLVTDIEQDSRFHKTRDRYNTRSFVSCPILIKNKLLGVLNLNDKKDGSPFTEEEFALIKVIANQAAIALKNAYLVNQLKTKAFELEEVNRKLIDAAVAKTEFLTRVSHELRTPLNSTKGAVYYLKNSSDLSHSAQQEFFDIITQETDKMTTIVENQLDFLRLEDESRITHRTIINLERAIREILSSRLLQTALVRKEVQADLNFPAEISDIAGDNILLAQVFINLIEGILPYLDRSSRIQILAEEDELITLCLQLNTEVPEEVEDFLFSTRNVYGTEDSEAKLKLYLARKAAEAHGWKLETAKSGKGFGIQVVIPKGARQRVDAAVNTTLDLFLDFLSEILSVNTCSIMLEDELTHDLIIRSARGLDEEIVKRTRIRVGERIAGWVAQEGRPLLVEDIRQDERFAASGLTDHYNTNSLMSVPLKIGDRVLGVINMNNKKSGESFTQTDLQVASALSERISHLVEDLYRDGHREEDLRRIISSFDNLLSAGRKYTRQRLRRSYLMGDLLEKYETGEEENRRGVYCAVVYDLGLMLIDESVLEKRRDLTPSERSTLQTHPHTTVGLLQDIEYSNEVREIILHHHEHFDGSGYPEGLSREQIPFLSRALAVIDAYCAMTEERSYRAARSKDEALAEMRMQAGRQFDPQMVEKFAEVLVER